jgi:hypothetical protein
MASTINASTSAGLVQTADTSGVLALQTANTTAVTLDASQNATFAGSVKTNTLTSAASTALTLQSAGTTAITVDTSQNVGIGTASPSVKLHVKSTANDVLMVESTNTYSFLDFTNPTGTAGIGNTGNAMRFDTGGSERMRIDSFGNVGIGNTSPTATLDTYIGSGPTSFGTFANSVRINGGNTSGKYVSLTFGGYGSNAPVAISYAVTTGTGNTNGDLIFGTRSVTTDTLPTERMRIDSSGNLLLNTTSPSSGGSLGNSVLTLKSSGTATAWGVGPTSSYGIFYVVNSSGTGVSLTSGNTSWAAQSDERLKDIIEPITNATQKVSTLRAVIGKYKTDAEGTRRSFLLAQDVKAVLPEVIDTAEDEQGTLSIRYTEVIPLLVASIQELKAINDTQAETINALTARVTALEGA